MKSKLKLLSASLCLCGLLALAAQAQTNIPVATPTNAVPTPASFFNTVEDYFTAFNTNSQTFSTNAPYEMWAGAAYQSGINLGAQFGVEAKPIAKWPGLTIGSVSTLANTVGTLAEEELDLGWSIRHYDVELTFGAGGIDNFGGGSVAPGFKGGIFAEVKKAIGANTFAGMRIEGIIGSGSKASAPQLGVFAGFTF